MNEGPRRRPFGLFSATALVVANMIGAGVFTTSGFSLADLGSRPRVMAAWVVGGAIALCGAVSYGGLVRRMAVSGGEYLFLSRVIHPGVGFLAGWVSLLAGFTGAIAFAATVLETYVVPQSIRPEWLPVGAVGIAAIVGCGLLHGIVVRYGVAAQNAIVLVKSLFVAGFVGFALIRLGDTGWPGLGLPEPAVAFSLTAFASSLVWISLSYSGFNAAVYVAGEIEDAPRTAPRALWLGTSIVFAVYLVLNGVFLFAPLPEDVAGRPDVAAAAATALGGGGLSTVLRIVISLALLSSVSSMIVAGPRVYAQMARDGVFPTFFAGSVDGPRERAPLASITLQVILASIVVSVTGLRELLSYLGIVLSMSAAGTVACLFVLRRREGKSAVAGIGYPVVPAVYVVATVVLGLLVVTPRPREWLAAVITMLSGGLAYRVFRSDSKRRRPNS
jgi:APA family basic amino acid/polyamine antiporter